MSTQTAELKVSRVLFCCPRRINNEPLHREKFYMPVGGGQFHVTRDLRDPRFHKNIQRDA